METSPFPFQGPLAADQVKGRTELLRDLIERATMRTVTALIGPRRYGKTSVLRKVAAVLEEAGTNVVWVDLYETRSMADLVVRFDDGLAAAGAGTGAHREIAASVGFNLGMFKLEFSKPVSQRPDPDAALHLVLDTLVTSAQRQPTVLIVDEFTGIRSVDGAAAMLRTKIQHHVQTLGVLFAGSEPTMLTEMFTDRAAPFYGQADLVTIEPFTNTELTDIIEQGFAETERKAGPISGHIHQFTGGHPFAAMQLASEAWQLTPAGHTADADTWTAALQRVEARVGPGLEVIFSSFSGSEQAVLRAIANDRPLFGGSLDLFDTSAGSVQAARDRFIANGTLSRELTIIDPFLRNWIRRRFAL